jgi:hypothetical protein
MYESDDQLWSARLCFNNTWMFDFVCMPPGSFIRAPPKTLRDLSYNYTRRHSREERERGWDSRWASGFYQVYDGLSAVI